MANGNVCFPHWYEWNVAHWGDEWNACYTEISQKGEAIKLSFATAWSIPWPIFEELVERFPKLTIEGSICEGMYNFGGDIRCQGGEIEYNDKSEEIQVEYERNLPPGVVRRRIQ